MKASSRAMGDVLLAGFAGAVLVASVLTVRSTPAPPVATLNQGSQTPVVPIPTTKAPVPTTAPSPSPTSDQPADPSAGPETIVVAGPDLAQLGAQLVAASGDTVLVAESNGPQVLADGALEAIDMAPTAVVIEVLAGTKTSVRTADAIATIKRRWPGVRIVVVGPFGADDRKSAAAVQTAAASAHVSFLDPVALHWRADATKAAVDPKDFAAIAAKLAAALR